MFCPYCGKSGANRNRMCPSCGKELKRIGANSEYECSACKKNAAADAQFCWFCGERLESRPEDRIDKEYIGNAVDQLVGSLGVKEDANYSEFETLLSAKEIRKCIKAIASQLGLPIEINLSFGPPDYAPGESYFGSRDVVATDCRGRGTAHITAQVSIPNDLPLYGNPKLANFPIDVKVSQDCNEQPETFVAVMAHELSHILLYSLMHPQKLNEWYTDLTAMVLGFSNIMEKGRKVTKVTTTSMGTETQTSTFGYLSDEHFDFARDKMNSILQERRAIKEKFCDDIAEFRRQCAHSKKILLLFTRFLEYLDKHRDRTIREADAPKIITFHQAEYAHALEVAIKATEEFLTVTTNSIEPLVHYTDYAVALIRLYENQMKVLRPSLGQKRAILNGDVKILRRYVSLWFRIKTTMEINKADTEHAGTTNAVSKEERGVRS